MRIEQIEITNFASLKHVDLPDLPNLVVFVGKNSAGKSNIIDALGLMFFEFGSDLRRNLGNLDEFQHLFHGYVTEVSPNPKISVSVSLRVEEWAELLEVDHHLVDDWGDTRLFLEKSILVEDGSVFWETASLMVGAINLVSTGAFQQDDIHVYDSPDGGPPFFASAEQFLYRLNDFMKSSFGVIHTSNSSRSWPDRFTERPTIFDTQHVDELWQLSQSRGNQRQPWTKMTQKFQDIAPSSQRPVGVASSVQVEEVDLTVPIGMTGEGSQATLRLIDQLQRGAPIVAIEEPETHLHPGLIRRVGQLLTETANSGKQLFICTHSPFLVDRSALENFFVVTKEPHTTTVSAMGGISDLRVLLYEIGMRPSDILFSDAILLVEGASDESFFDIVSQRISASLAERNVKVIPVGGYPQGNRKIDFWAEVGQDAALPLYLILDNGARREAENAIDGGRVIRGNCLILDQDALEDLYPWGVLQEVLSTEFGKEVAEEIPVGQRVNQLRNLFKSEYGKNGWKPLVAEAVAKKLTPSQVEEGMKDVFDFLHVIHRQTSFE